MASDMLNAHKKGNITLCNTGLGNEHITSYCNKNFADDVNSNQDCKDSNLFCNICCETEFG